MELQRFRDEIGRVFAACRECDTPATVNFARSYLADLTAAEVEFARAALRRWFRSTPRAGPEYPGAALAPISADQPMAQAGSRSVTPPPAAADLGGPAWERALIKALRERGLLWWTEQTYRDWQPGSPSSSRRGPRRPPTNAKLAYS